jgi:protein involved in polysaccharide export with SLBB domain
MRSREQTEDLAAARRARRTPAALFDELNWDYAVVERLNEADLSTQVIPFNLGKAVLQGDEASNIELRAGDVVTVYSQKDVRVPVARQTRLVSLEGEVGAPGVYQLVPGETLRSLLQRAGGFTPQAYVYGLEFSREETRLRQRENLNEAIARLESLAATQTARDAANRRDDTTAAGASAVSSAATQAQLARLSRLQPNGRIALELSPSDQNIDALPDVPLEHGDRISVPPRPGFVTVAGAVVNSNAFLWKPGRTAGEYLRLAGTDEAADPTNMFILRADGTVAHASDKRGFFSRSGLESTQMQPGDALIVPSQLDFETFGRALVRNLKDWSQIFSQFGLGAAAIKTLRN